MLQNKLSAESERVERAFTDVVKHTEFVTKVILSQIKHDPKNLRYIESVINKYSVNPHLNNVLSWTVFCWFDDKDIKKVDSVSGIAVKPANYSTRTYISEARNAPGTLYLGKDIFGLTSQKHILPAAIGAADNEGKFLGSLTIGFDLANFIRELEEKIKDPDTSFAILNSDFEIVSQFNSLEHTSDNKISSKTIQKLVSAHNIKIDSLTQFSEINLIFKNHSFYMQKIPDYPFAVYLQYHNSSLIKTFHKDILYRVFEVLIFTAVSLFIITLIYRREKKLRDKAEQSKTVAIQALQNKNDFLAYTAHELRSPLSFIVSSSEIMTSKLFGPMNDKYLEYINNINQSGKELLVFIEDLLENMKLQKGHFTIHESSVDVKSLILRATKVNNVNYDDKIIIETYFQKTLPHVKSDPKRLLQIFNNIISNATKYSPANSTLRIDVKMHKGEMFVHFHDTGYGMSEEGLQKSLHEFEIAHDINASNVDVKSVGLGLPLIKSLLELMELKFFIDSKLGAGTNILIVFPKHKIIKKS